MIAGTILVVALDRHAYASAMIVLAALSLIGLAAALLLPKETVVLGGAAEVPATSRQPAA